MKKGLLALSLACAAMAAQAENWIMIQETDTGARLLVDVDSYKAIKGDNGAPFAAALFRFFKDGEAGEPFAYVVDTASCKNMNGTVYSRILENNKWVTSGKYWWSKNGNKMYDSGGEILCIAYNKITGAQKSGTAGKNMI